MQELEIKVRSRLSTICFLLHSIPFGGNLILAEKLISFQKHPVEKYIYKQKLNTTMLHDCEILNTFEKTYPTEQTIKLKFIQMFFTYFT